MSKKKLKKNKKTPKREKKKNRRDRCILSDKSIRSSKSNSSISSDTNSDSSISLSSIDEETKKKLFRKLKKLKRKHKHKQKKKKALKNSQKIDKIKNQEFSNVEITQGPCTSLMKDASAEKSKSLAPMTKEEWEKQQNTLKHVYDEATGRIRLVKGTGEIVEECVSRERHLAINKQATMSDGEYFNKILQKQTSTSY